jgi:hypothetical protein
MNVAELLSAVRQAVNRRAYLARLDILDQTPTMVKARLYITPDLFVQVYRNDRYDTTNLVLLHAGQRMYARDQLGGVWHRHTAGAPDQHDTRPEGQRPVNLAEFLDEVEAILAERGLP